MSTDQGSSLYDWDWTDAPPALEERYEPDREYDGPDVPDDDEFYWAERLKNRGKQIAQAARSNLAQTQPQPSSEPSFLKIWDGPDQTRPINATAKPTTSGAVAPVVAKRSDGYKPVSTSNAIGTVARVPTVPNANPYQQIRTSNNSAPAPVNQSQHYVAPNYQNQEPPPLHVYRANDIDSVVEELMEIEEGRRASEIPRRKRAEYIQDDIAPRFKVSRQLFLMMNAINLSHTTSAAKLKAVINKIIECTIPESDAEAEICLYNANESVSQLIIQMVGTREEEERVLFFEGARSILDRYLPSEIAAKEFVKANNTTYPHPAYVGLQASLDMLNYISIWASNLNLRKDGKYIVVADYLSDYLRKYRNRLTRLPSDLGRDTSRAIFYYE